MGAGKTTFIQALCEVKNVKETLGSPTFSIINEYSYSGGRIFHIDLYRLNDEDEAIGQGWKIVCIPARFVWSNGLKKHPGFFLRKHIHISISCTRSQTRLIREEASHNCLKFNLKL